MNTPIHRILVATDFSEPADAALEYARTLGHRLGASVHLLHVLNEPLLAEGLTAEAYMNEAPSLRDELVEEARRGLRAREHATASAEFIFGQTAPNIVSYASRLGVDLIVMGTRGRTGIAHVLLGSVAEVVVRTAPCPVMTVQHLPSGADAPRTASAEVPASAS